MGAKGLSSQKRALGIAGIILSILGLILSIINAILGAILAASGNHEIVNQLLK
jgi:hypothetical protein